MISTLDYCRMLAGTYKSSDISQWPSNLICRGGKQQERHWSGWIVGIFSRGWRVWKTWGSWLPAASGSTADKERAQHFFCLIANNKGIWIYSPQPWQRISNANHHAELMFFKTHQKWQKYKISQEKENCSQLKQKRQMKFHNSDVNKLFIHKRWSQHKLLRYRTSTILKDTVWVGLPVSYIWHKFGKPKGAL